MAKGQRNDRLIKEVKDLPSVSGVYLMKDDAGRVIYVGKAVDLRKRVQSYFRKRTMVSKTDFLVEKICDLDYILTESEAEALILEAALIKQYQPKYNVDLRDDKTYPYIEITGEDFPRIAIVRPRQRAADSVYYGPYTSVTLIREALQIIRRIFPFRTCDPMPDKACLDFHMGLCAAPCEKKQTRQEYQKTIRRVQWILQGKKDLLYKRLSQDMQKFSQTRCFEKAAEVRDQIRAIGALYSGTGDVNYFKEAEQIQRAFHLVRLPQRIETFDISNTMGHQSVGSMVSFLNGRPDKAHYRRFRIKTVEGIDDYQMIAEVVRRRYQRLRDEKKLFPDLIIIDGGKGQLSAACRELSLLGVEIPIVALAKREEEVFLPGRRKPVVLFKDSLGLKLLQRCRDEAHRFAVAYHRTLRGKTVFPGRR